MRRALGVGVLLMLAGCVTPQRGPEPAVPTPVVEAPVPQIPVTPPPDLRPLAGRRIVVDPGHGGPWPGAVAPSNGLREADLNLRVALELARLARGAGADVTLTRGDDSVPAPDNASQDLAARADLANRSGAEAFISIHHNADIASGSGRNDLEVYYKLGDAAASLDLGQSLTYELAYRLRRDATAKLLLPGNYKVLRESRLPSTLLESSYMTHAGNATLMATEEGVRAEALAIAAGLARYFSLDPPAPASTELVESHDPGTHGLVARFSRGLPIDPATVRVSLEGRELPGKADFGGDTLRWTFQEPLPNGDLRFEVRVQNARGAATTFPVDGRVNRPVAHVVPLQRPRPFGGSTGAEMLFEVRVEDELGLPVADGTPVRFVATGAVVETRNGVARFYLPVVEAASAEPKVFEAQGERAGYVLYGSGYQFRSVRVRDAVTGAYVPGAVVRGGDGALATTTDEGWAELPAATAEVSVARDGYEPAAYPLQAPHALLDLAPRHGGALHGKRIVVDAAYGGRNAGAIGPLGTRASDINLDVARQVAAGLREAGADVLLTRDDDSDPSDLQRVEMADAFGATVVVSVSYGGPGSASRVLDAQGLQREAGTAFVGHYPNSPNGTRLARNLAGALGIANVAPSVAYLVQQTASPAVLVQPDTVADAEAESRLRDAKARQADARALCDGLVAYFTSAQ